MRGNFFFLRCCCSQALSVSRARKYMYVYVYVSLYIYFFIYLYCKLWIHVDSSNSNPNFLYLLSLTGRRGSNYSQCICLLDPADIANPLASESCLWSHLKLALHRPPSLPCQGLFLTFRKKKKGRRGWMEGGGKGKSF